MAPSHAELYSCAAHEVGHALAFKAASVKIFSVVVWTNGNLAYGEVDVNEPSKDKDDDLTAYLTAILAGHEAQVRWLVKNGGRFTLGAARKETKELASVDLAWFKRYAKGSGISEAQARKRAQDFARSNWNKIDKLANKLAKHGSLKPSEI